ncbi:MAG TPA: MlaD family protein [Baekduia sp.]|nr:MlaD family protein [Baekduia sp.]
MRARLTALAGSDARLGALVLALGGALLVLGLTGAIGRLLHDDPTRVVRAAFADSQQLRPGDKVRIQGVQAGEVTATERAPDGRSTIVTMDVERDAGPLYADAGAVLRFHTVLGGNFYVDLERGSRARGLLQGLIPTARTARQTELDDVASIVRGGAASGLRRLPPELAQAFADRRTPGRLLDEVARVAPDVRAGVGALRGEALEGDLRGLVADTSRTMRALHEPRGELRGLVSGAAATLDAIAARGGDVRALARRAPATLAEVDRTARRLAGTLRLATPLLADLEDPAGEVAPTLRDVRPVVAGADGLVRRAAPLVRALRPAVGALAGAARAGDPLLRDLTPSLERLDRTILPYLAEKDAGTGKSTAVMIGGTFAALAAGAGGQMDANGHFIRFPATVGSSPAASLPCQVYIENPDVAQAVACQTLQEAVSTYFGYQPLAQTPGTEPAQRRRTTKEAGR